MVTLYVTWRTRVIWMSRDTGECHRENAGIYLTLFIINTRSPTPRRLAVDILIVSGTTEYRIAHLPFRDKPWQRQVRYPLQISLTKTDRHNTQSRPCIIIFECHLRMKTQNCMALIETWMIKAGSQLKGQNHNQMWIKWIFCPISPF